MTKYWSQFDKEEIDSMKGIEEYTKEEDDTDLDQEKDDADLIQIDCRRCDDHACNYCLMLDY